MFGQKVGGNWADRELPSSECNALLLGGHGYLQVAQYRVYDPNFRVYLVPKVSLVAAREASVQRHEVVVPGVGPPPKEKGFSACCGSES